MLDLNRIGGLVIPPEMTAVLIEVFEARFPGLSDDHAMAFEAFLFGIQLTLLMEKDEQTVKMMYAAKAEADAARLPATT